MSRMIILCFFLCFQISHATSSYNDPFNRFQRLYDEDKEKCFLVAKSRIDNNTDNFIPYYFLLKIELERYQELPYVGFIDNEYSTVNNTYHDYTEPMFDMIGYTNAIYKLANEQELYATDCFILFSEMNDELGELCLALHRSEKMSLKDRLLERANSFYTLEIIVYDGGALGRKYSQDHRVVDAFPNLKVNIFLNGLPDGNENIPSFNEEIELEFLRILNRARREKGLPLLEFDEDLCRAARYHSYDMGSQNYFAHASHDRPNNGSKLIEVCSTFERIRKFAPCYGENIDGGNGSAEGAYNQWFNSPGHHDIMFKESFTRIGIGLVKVPGSRLTYYWTADFR